MKNKSAALVTNDDSTENNKKSNVNDLNLTKTKIATPKKQEEKSRASLNNVDLMVKQLDFLSKNKNSNQFKLHNISENKSENNTKLANSLDEKMDELNLNAIFLDNDNDDTLFKYKEPKKIKKPVVKKIISKKAANEKAANSILEIKTVNKISTSLPSNNNIVVETLKNVDKVKILEDIEKVETLENLVTPFLFKESVDKINRQELNKVIISLKKTEPIKETKVVSNLVEKEFKIKMNLSILNFTKNVFLGLSKNYQKKSTPILESIYFLLENFVSLTKGIFNLSIPLLMTWLIMSHFKGLTESMEINHNQWYSFGVFISCYFASFFVWTCSYVTIVSIKNGIKSILHNLAKTGQN